MGRAAESGRGRRTFSVAYPQRKLQTKMPYNAHLRAARIQTGYQASMHLFNILCVKYESGVKKNWLNSSRHDIQGIATYCVCQMYGVYKRLGHLINWICYKVPKLEILSTRDFLNVVCWQFAHSHLASVAFVGGGDSSRYRAKLIEFTSVAWSCGRSCGEFTQPCLSCLSNLSVERVWRDVGLGRR